MSETAKSRLSRASSFDTDLIRDSPSTSNRQPNQGQQQQRKAEPQIPSANGNLGENDNFFSSLQWSNDTGERSQNAEPSESHLGLLNNDSDDDDDNFANIRVDEKLNEVPAGYEAFSDASKTKDDSTFNLFSSEFRSQDVTNKSDEVDLLRITSEKPYSIVDQMDLLNIGVDTSNFDLLSSHDSNQKSRAPNSHEPDLLGMSAADDTFEPFQKFSAGPAMTPTKPDLMTSLDPSSDTTFDPFTNFSSDSQADSTTFPGQTSSSQTVKPHSTDDNFLFFMEGTQSSGIDAEPDLMTSWTATSIRNVHQQTSAFTTSNLIPGFGSMHKSASTGSAMNFSSMLDNHGGRSSPQAGMLSSGLGQIPKNDPFADFGKL